MTNQMIQGTSWAGCVEKEREAVLRSREGHFGSARDVYVEALMSWYWEVGPSGSKWVRRVEFL